MNKGFFTGRVAKAPIYRDGGGQPVCYINLVRNEYAGRGDEGEVNEREVGIQFTAFGSLATTLKDHALVGDQLIIEYHVANAKRERAPGMIEYGFSFLVDSFEFGAPGQIKRERLAQQRTARG